MKIRDLTVPELNHYRQYCNFTAPELAVFDGLASGMTLEECSDSVHQSVSTVNRLNRSIKSKMNRV